MKRIVSSILAILMLTACTPPLPHNSSSVLQSETQIPQSLTAEKEPVQLDFYPPQHGNITFIPPNHKVYEMRYHYENTDKKNYKEYYTLQSFDLKNNKAEYLCAKEGCKHMDESCTACLKGQTAISFIPMKNEIVLLRQEPNDTAANLSLITINYESAERKNIPLKIPPLDFAYNNIETAWGSGFAADDKNIYCVLHARQVEILLDGIRGDSLKSKYYIMRVNLETGACDIIESSDYRFYILGSLGNSLVVIRDLGPRSAMVTDPKDPNTPFYEIITLPLDGTPETVHHTAPMRSETLAYDQNTHAIYYALWEAYSDKKIYKLDLLTGENMPFAQISLSQDTADKINIDMLIDGYLLLWESNANNYRHYSVSLKDGTVLERTAINSALNSVMVNPYASLGDNYLVFDGYGVGFYSISKDDFWADTPNLTKQEKFTKFRTT